MATRKRPAAATVPAPALPEAAIPAPPPDLVLSVRCEDKTRRHACHHFTVADDGRLRLFTAAGGDPVVIYNTDVWWSVEWVPLPKAPEGEKK